MTNVENVLKIIEIALKIGKNTEEMAAKTWKLSKIS